MRGVFKKVVLKTGIYCSLTILAHSNHKQFSTAGTSLNRAYKDVQIA